MTSVQTRIAELSRRFRPVSPARSRKPGSICSPVARSVETLEPRQLLTTFLVDDDGNGDFLTIQAAIDAAADDDTIQISGGADGIHTEFDIDVDQSLTIEGVPSENRVIVQGAATLAEATREVFDVRPDLTVTIRELTIRHGNQSIGSAIDNGADLTLENLSIVDNRGTAIRHSGPSLLVIDTEIRNNTSMNLGGGIYVSSSEHILLERVTIEGNSTSTSGGAIYFSTSDTTLEIRNSRIANNRGGGIRAFGSDSILIVRESEIVRNTATSSGSGISASLESVIIEDSLISRNSSTLDGGGLDLFSTSTLISNTTISQNTTNSSGGGIQLSIGDSTTIINSTIFGNIADNDRTTPTSIPQAGGIDGNSENFRLVNSIVMGNLSGGQAVRQPSDLRPRSTGIQFAANNIIGDADTAGGLIDGENGNIVGVNGVGTLDPSQVLDTALRDNGGPTETHALVLDGLAIDAGNNTFATVDSLPMSPPLSGDQRGMSRFDNGITDIGAFELRLPRVLVTFKDVSAQEDDGSVTFTVSLERVLDEDLTFHFQTHVRLAEPNDFEQKSGTATIPAGELFTTVTINLTPDEMVERDETFFLEVSNFTTNQRVVADVPDPIAEATILNDDFANFSISDVTAVEGSEALTTFQFLVTLDNDVDVPVSVDFMTRDDSAISTGETRDFVAAAGTLFFSGQKGETIPIEIIVGGDRRAENDERLFVDLSNVQAAGRSVGITDGTGEGEILNDDTATLSINSVTQAEGDDGTAFTFDVSLSDVVDGGLTVDFEVLSGTATAGHDFAPLMPGTLTFSGLAGETQQITVLVTGDSTAENTETFTIALGNLQASATGVSLGTTVGVGTILNDDSATLSIDDVAQSEGDTGGTVYTFTVTLNADVEGGLQVDARTLGDSATSDVDFLSIAAQTLTFVGFAGEQQQFSVTVSGDEVAERDETFFAELLNLQTAVDSVTIAKSLGVGTILNDDMATLTIDDVTELEGDDASQAFTFTVTLDNAVEGGLQIGARTTGVTTTSDDLQFVGPQTLVFQGIAGEQHQVTVQVFGDEVVERDENFLVELFNLQTSVDSVTIAKTIGIGTILNDDAASISIDNVSGMEGDTGETVLTFTVTLDADVEGGLQVDYNDRFGTANGRGDYRSIDPGTLVFQGFAGEQRQISVAILGDTLVERNETFSIELSNLQSLSQGVTIADGSGGGIIFDDDSASLSISDAIRTEGDNGLTTLTFDVTLDNDVDTDVIVDFATRDETADSTDFSSPIDTSSILVTANNQLFEIRRTGEILRTVNIPYPDGRPANEIARDLVIDADGEVQVYNGTNSPFLSTYDAAIDDWSHQPFVGWSTDVGINSGGIAELGDFVFATDMNTLVGDDSERSGLIRFDRRNQTATRFLDGNDVTDVTVGLDGSLYVVLSRQAYFRVDPVSLVLELPGRGVVAQELRGIAVGEDGTVYVATRSGQIQRFAENRQFLDSVNVVENLGILDEFSDIDISRDGELLIGTTSGRIILGDVSLSDFRVVSDFGDSNVFVAFGQSQVSSLEQPPQDYVATSGSLVFSGRAGETRQIQVVVAGDERVELDETFLVELSNVQASSRDVTLADAQGQGTILDDDVATLTIDDVVKSEGTTETTEFVFTVSLDTAVEGGFSIDFETIPDLEGMTTSLPAEIAEADVDFLSQMGTLFFEGFAGEQQQIVITVQADDIIETDEAFGVLLSNLQANGNRVRISDLLGTGTILDDETVIVTGAAAGFAPEVRVLHGETKRELFNIMAYDEQFLGGVSVAVGDINNDGISDFVVGPGMGGGPHIKIFDGLDGEMIGEFFAFDAMFRGGVDLAVGTFSFNPFGDIVVGAGFGGGPHVRVFEGFDFRLIREFFAYDVNFRGGVSVATGQPYLTTNNIDQIITGTGPGGGPHVKIFHGEFLTVIDQFMAYDPNFLGGVNVSYSPPQFGFPGYILTSPGAGGGPHIKRHRSTQAIFAFENDLFTGVLTAIVPKRDGGQHHLLTLAVGTNRLREFPVFPANIPEQELTLPSPVGDVAAGFSRIYPFDPAPGPQPFVGETPAETLEDLFADGQLMDQI